MQYSTVECIKVHMSKLTWILEFISLFEPRILQDLQWINLLKELKPWHPIQILTIVVLNNSAGLTVFLHIRLFYWLIGFIYPNKTNIFIKCWRQLVLLSCIYYCIEFFVLLALNKINEIKKRIFYSKHDFIGLSNQNTKY